MLTKKIQLRAYCEKTAEGNLRVVATDETLDRSGESIPFDSWDLSKFEKSPRILVDHDYRVQAIVGKGINIEKDAKRKAITFEPVFHSITQVARDTKEMVEQGFLDTVSVGFLRNENEKGEQANELMEISFVAVPANPSARVLSIKSIEPEDEKAIKKFLDEFKKDETEDVQEQEKPEKPEESEESETEDQETQEIEDEINDDTKEIKKNEIIEKTGRVLSKKNRAIISTAKDAMSSGVIALEELLKATESSESNESDGEGQNTDTSEGDEDAKKVDGENQSQSREDKSYQRFIELRKAARVIQTTIAEALHNAKLN